ncbi:MAG: hypothetical protein ACK51T_02255, partial [bacterium]
MGRRLRSPVGTLDGPDSPAEGAIADVVLELKPAPHGMLIEVAWEVCNPIGGIFQVIRSKAPAMVERWGERYCL